MSSLALRRVRVDDYEEIERLKRAYGLGAGGVDAEHLRRRRALRHARVLRAGRVNVRLAIDLPATRWGAGGGASVENWGVAFGFQRVVTTEPDPRRPVSSRIAGSLDKR